MIELNDVCAGYKGKTVARGIRFSACSGTITVLLGKNGCGKSTLLRAIAGNLPYTGSILLDGQEIRHMRPRERARRLAVMPQLLRSPDISVRELVSYGRQPYTGITGALSAADQQAVENAIRETGIEPLSDSFLDRISGGERQKAYFALLLAQDTPNWLLDEPGAFLDAEYMNSLCGFLSRAKQSGKTVLTVLHDINRALEIADQLIVLRDEGIAFCGAPDAFLECRIAERFFGLRRFDCIGDGQRAVLFR